jgi:hypothetical protein
MRGNFISPKKITKRTIKSFLLLLKRLNINDIIAKVIRNLLIYLQIITTCVIL